MIGNYAGLATAEFHNLIVRQTQCVRGALQRSTSTALTMIYQRAQINCSALLDMVPTSKDL
jgi:hypothetical protein